MVNTTSKANTDFLYRKLVDCAEHGQPAPSNEALADLIGWSDGSTVGTAMRRLESEGRIKVERFPRARIVTIVATGKQTAKSVHQERRQTDAGAESSAAAQREAGIARRTHKYDTVEMKAKLGTAAIGAPSLGGFQGRPLRPGEGCRWIEGNDYLDKIREGQDPACGAPRLPGRSYCRHHLERSLPKKDAAA